MISSDICYDATSRPCAANQAPVKDWSNDISTGGRFSPEKDRYHLYAAWFCPFAHRVLLMRQLKHLEDYISLSIVHWYKGDYDEKQQKYPGWHFETAEEEEGCIPDPLFGSKWLSEIYYRAEPRYEGKYSVPVLWDKKTNTIVSNDSAQIMRNLSMAFDDILPDGHPGKGRTYYPSKHAKEIDDLGKTMQENLNTGVYKAGFADNQQDYEGAVTKVFETLDLFEARLEKSGGPFVLGKEMTELDIRLFSTLIRFDPVYAFHFKCNLSLIRSGEYPLLHLWLRRLYHQVPGISSTFHERHIKLNYYVSHKDVNPKGLVPMGPRPFIRALKEEERAEGVQEGARGVLEGA